jgi:PAS domain S-box-containing protein
VRRQTVARRRDGTLVEVQLSARPILGPDGRTRGAAITVLDISISHRAQHLLDQIIANAPCAIAVKDLDGRYVSCSEHGAAGLGRRVEDIVGHTDEDIFPADVVERFRRQDRQIVTERRAMTYEETLPDVEGRELSYLTTKFPLPSTDGTVAAIGVISVDVTGMRRAEHDQAQLAAVVRAAPDAIVARDRDGRITAWNPGAEAMFGRPAEEAIGRYYDELIVPPEDRETFARLLAEVHAGRTLSTRADRLRADGSRFCAQVSMAPLTLLDGSWHGSLSMIRDITDLVEAERELRERAALLEQSNADLERFAYAASHDLQEPLSSIRLSAGAVIEAARERLDADECELMHHIDAAALRLSDQIRGLMQVSQVAMGGEAGERQPLAVVVHEAVDSLRAAVDAAHARLALDEPLPTIPVPRVELSAVMQNLISNAIKYARPGVPPTISVSASVDPALLQITVADNGMGLTDSELNRVFGLFERGRSEVPGTGMGLATARRMLERHGGTILAESDGPGHGSKFLVLLPVPDPAP